MKIRIGLIAALFLLALLPAAEAQEEGTTIYLHGMDASWGGTPMSLSFNPPTGAESATTCTGCIGPSPFTESASWTVPVDLTPTGGTTGTGTGYLKSWNNAPAPASNLAFSIKVDGTEVASGDATADVMLGAIVRFDMTMTFTGAAIPKGSEMVLDFEISDDTTGGYNPAAYPKEGPAYPWSFTLPVSKPLPPPPAEVLPAQFEDVTADTILLDYAYPEAASQEWTYNWTNQNPVGNITVAADILQGSVQFVIRDEFNDTLFDATLEATYEQNATFEGFEGNWTVYVAFTDFMGNASFAILPDLPPVINPVTGEPVGGEPGSGEPGNQEPGNGNTGEVHQGGNADDESKDSPGIPLLIALIGLAFVARRRA